MGSYIPIISFQKFLDHLAPPQPDFDHKATMQSLKSGSEPVLTSSNRWSKFANAPKDSQGSEDGVFRLMLKIFTKVVVAIVGNSGGKLKEEERTVDFLQNPSRAPTSAERHNSSRPDGYFVLKDRNKEMSRDGKKEYVHWADIALSCEYKRKDGYDDRYDDVRKCVWSLQHAMRDDPRRRATFGMTIESSTTRLWFCCRAAIVVSTPFDFILEPENLIKLFAAFAYANRESLGFDTTIQPTPESKGKFVITIHPDNDRKDPRTFQTTKILSSYSAEPLRGRGTRVFEAVEIDGKNGTPKGPPVVLKDFWIDSDRMREGNILASILAEAEAEDKPLVEKYFLTTICHGDVWTELDMLDDTANALMRGLNITPNHNLLFKLQWTPVFPNSEPPVGSEGLREVTRVQVSGPHLRYAHKTHYRIVFKEKCTTIDRMKSLPDVMTVLIDTVSALRLLRKLGWVHRDVSIGNILSHNGHAKLADLEYAKKMSDLTSHEMRTGTMQFMSIEVAAQTFLFAPSDPLTSAERNDDMDEDEGTAQTEVPFSHNHLHDLESLWWVAVWMVFYNYFSEGTPSHDRPSITLQDAEGHLSLAGCLFPPALDNNTRRDAFVTRRTFQRKCEELPRNKKAIYNRLDRLRRLLIEHYGIVEAGFPLSVDPNSSGDGIYDDFKRFFSNAKAHYHNMVLDYIPDFHKVLLKEESKRRRSESTTEAGASRKTPRM